MTKPTDTLILDTRLHVRKTHAGHRERQSIFIKYTLAVVVAVMLWWWAARSTLRFAGSGRGEGQEEEEAGLEETALRALGPLEAIDPHLLRLLMQSYLEPPSSEPPDLMLDRAGPDAERYNIYRVGFPSWIRTNMHLKTLFSGSPPGFFLEAGALDGEFISNTLYLERELGWTGLLVEADPTLYLALTGKRRRAWSSRGCLATAPYPQQLVFHGYSADATASVDTRLLVRSTGNLEGVRAPAAGQMGTLHREVVQCFPLHSFLLAVNATSLQYVSLDVEGAEADILINLPWEDVDVTVWSIEHRLGTNSFKDLYEQIAAATNREDVTTVFSRIVLESPRSTYMLPTSVNTVTKVVYVQGQRDPSQGKDPYFTRFMGERGYVLYDYWDGDYTFIKRNSSVCRQHCPSQLPS